MKKILMVFYCFLLIRQSSAQCKPVPMMPNYNLISDTTSSKDAGKTKYYNNQRDLIDLGLILMHKNPHTRTMAASTENTRLHVSAAPIFEYTLSTGFATGMAANGSFLTNKQNTNTSSFLAAIKYTQKKQFLFPIQTTVWTKNNAYNWLGDWRYLNFPQDTYGFGSLTTPADGYVVDYKQICFYETVLKNVGKNFYVGIGYKLDQHWNIAEKEVPAGIVTDFDKYGLSTSSTSSGLAINFLIDSRKNSINPEGGSFYANLEILQNSKLLGSNSNWNSMLLDVREYFKMPGNTVLACWFYSMLTLSGAPPYLDLPSTASDTYNNTGRGYEQGRFTGKKMVDFEVEYRFDITRDGLLGGVVFGNVESLSELYTNAFEAAAPGFGVGLRIKFNKFSNTNVCIDYGAGRNGSRGFFGNLGEVF